MDFGSDYWNAMDKTFEKAKELRIDPRQIGISHGIGELGEGLKANIFRGASLVELGFFGAGKGFRSQATGHTPETYGKTEREEIRQLAKINEVELTTHASPNVGYAAGFQEGTFRDEARESVLHEVERAVDFAADTAGGGPVVMHLGEFPRPLYEIEGKDAFKAYEEEPEKAPVYIVDDRTGKIVALSRADRYAVPESYEDKEKQIPTRDEKGNVQWKYQTLGELEKDYLEEQKKKGEPPDVAKFLYNVVLEKDLTLLNFEVGRAKQQAELTEKQASRLQEAYDRIQRDEDPDRKRYQLLKLAEQFESSPKPGQKEHEELLSNPEKFVQEGISRFATETHYWRDAQDSYGRRRFETENALKNHVPIIEYGVGKSADTIARAAMYAYEKEKKQQLEKPLWIAPENWTPELYGSHPSELREIITKSRDRMAELLQQQKKMSEAEAKKVASEHVKATFDIGHLNFWKKYYKGSDEDFKGWINDQVKGLVKDGIIGHVHLSDNFGYHDEHLAPGEGNAPIQEFVERLKEAKFKGKIIAEPGGQKEGQHYRVLTESWKLLGSPIYRIDSLSRSWTDIESGYFGRAPQSPYFVVGDYAPSKDWTLWSETPLE